MQTRIVQALGLIFCAVMAATPASGQNQSENHRHFFANSATFVYVQTQDGVQSFQVSATGSLTMVPGSPFKTEGDVIGSNGSYLVSLDGTVLRSYPIQANGALGSLASSTDTAAYSGGGCGYAAAAKLDPTGNYVEVLYDPTIYVSSPCTGYQTFALLKTSGAFTFLGNAVVSTDIGAVLDPLTMTHDSKFAYALNIPPDPEPDQVVYAGFTRDSAGALANLNFAESDPQPQEPWEYFAWLVEADSTNHLAIALGQLEYYGSPLVKVGPTQLASYTIDASGNIATSNTWQQMPVPEVGPTLLRISPGGDLLAVAGNECPWCQISVDIAQDGLQLFHFNGADPITSFTGSLTSDPIDEIEWDGNNHLFAVSNSAGKLYVFTATATGVSPAPGSPYAIANPNGNSPNGLVVTTGQTCTTKGKSCQARSIHPAGDPNQDR